ncbi:9007_t:CDS:2 [Dentiscutata erythropus]|uniref:9007_t:CDS:1 n=1 Tax=Dentiscutata erythropus TaxID=1348616 RepID=A0A9N9DLF3_9GLOM|nr:9007_t:CDS:2 [Dentiscutata erythropus]
MMSEHIREDYKTGRIVLNEKELVEISFALLILRLFQPEFYFIGMVFILFGGSLLGISMLRRRHNIDVLDQSKPFKTAGKYVVITGLISMFTYVTLLVMIFQNVLELIG